jgi:hypothetical protein
MPTASGTTVQQCVASDVVGVVQGAPGQVLVEPAGSRRLVARRLEVAQGRQLPVELQVCPSPRERLPD